MFFLNEFEEIIRGLLLNVSLILLPTFIYESFKLDKLGYVSKKVKPHEVAILTSISVILCMTFAIPLFNGHLYDLRMIPVLVSFFYGGVWSGIITVTVMFFYRWYLFSEGFYTMIVVYSFVVIIAAYISPRYFNLRRRDKFLIVATITIIAMVLMFLASYLMNVNKEGFSLIELIKFFLLFTFIKILALHFTIYILEGFVEKRELRIELQRVDRLNTVGGLAASIAHEIRNPLTVAKGFMQLIQKNGDNLSQQKIQEYLDIAITETNRAEKVIADFLSFANPSVENQRLINVSDLISMACNIMYSYATLNDISINKTLDKGCYLFTDENKLTQVFVNIIKNSIEAMPNGGEIDVRVFKDKKHVIIEVEDYGIGMTKEEISRLGTPFYTLKSSGTGLGLMISYKYVQILGGKIKVESEKGKGTKFTVTFPIYQMSSQEMDTIGYISE